MTGVIVVTVIVQLLRHLEAGIPVGGLMLRIPQGSQEIGLGIAMALILIFRPDGLTRGNEVPWPFAGRTRRRKLRRAPAA